MAQKWENTKKEKAAVDKISRQIGRDFGFKMSSTKSNPRVAAAMKAAKNAKAEKVVVKSPGQQAEAEYAKLYRAGKVGPKNINQIKEKIANKWGVWPNGGVN
jgi:hypothetical protein